MTSKSNINEYLKLHSKESEVTLIGPLLKEAISNVNEPIIYIDGGAQFKIKDAGFSVGDGDSAKCLLDQKLPEKKDFSDLAFALQSIPEQFTQIYLLGFLGGRSDHQLFNFAEAHSFLKYRTQSTVFFDDAIIAVSKGAYELELNGRFSLFCFEDNNITLSGDCEFQLLKQKLKPLSSHGLSNYSSGKIQLKCDKPALIFNKSC